MKKICLLMAALFTLVAFSSVAAARNRVALLPYINASEEHKGYVDEAVLAGYTFRFDNDGYEMVPEAEMARALENCDYTTDDEELPDKDQLASVAEETGADFVVAMSIETLNASRHVSFFQAKVTAKGKLAYKVYAAGSRRLYAFKTSSTDDNKTVFGGVGYKSPIINVLEDALEQGHDKVTAYIAENSTTNVVTRPTPRRQQVAESAEAQMASVQDTRDETRSPRSVAHYPRVRRATASEDDR